MEQEISAANVFLANLMYFGGSSGPVTSDTGGSSTSDPNAGTESGNSDKKPAKPITTGDKAGAGILTAIFVAGWAGSMVWLLTGA